MSLAKKIIIIACILLIGIIIFAFVRNKQPTFIIEPSLSSGVIEKGEDGRFYIDMDGEKIMIRVSNENGMPFLHREILTNNDGGIAMLVAAFYGPGISEQILYGTKPDVSYLYYVLFVSNDKIVSKRVEDAKGIEWVDPDTLKVVHFTEDEVSYIKNPFK